MLNAKGVQIVAEAQNRSLARGLDILTLLSDEVEGLELHQIARQLALPKSSCSVLLHTLEQKKFLHYDEKTARYRVTTRLFEIGSAALRDTTVESLLRKRMREVAKESRETVHCGMLDGAEVVYIDKMESTQSIRMTSRVGLRMPLYATAMGRAMLAEMPEAEVEAMLLGARLAPITPKTIVDPAKLREIIAQIREDGFATEYEETNANVCCIGVAICLRDGVPGYAMSISMPQFRFTPEVLETHARLLKRAKRKIELVLSAGI